jgi:hypothetical protein
MTPQGSRQAVVINWGADKLGCGTRPWAAASAVEEAPQQSVLLESFPGCTMMVFRLTVRPLAVGRA